MFHVEQFFFTLNFSKMAKSKSSIPVQTEMFAEPLSASQLAGSPTLRSSFSLAIYSTTSALASLSDFPDAIRIAITSDSV